MKKLLLLFAFTVLAFASNAKDVTYEQARQKALDLLGVESVDGISGEKHPHAAKERENATPSYYIFGNTKGKGFVIISGDDRLPEVFGYSHDETLVSDGNMPPALANLLRLYSEYVEAIRSNAAVVEPPHNRQAYSGIEVQPLLSTQWGQDKPYNNLCPTGTVTGCVATATSQIMRYHKWPMSGMGVVSTIYDGKSMFIDLSQSFYNWDAMKNTAKENLVDETSAEAVAKLCYDCGVAVKMSYGETSGAYDFNVVKVLNDNFYYKGSTLRSVFRDCFSTDEWMDIVKTELIEERPVYYSAQSPMGGGKDAAGHAFVIDGCKSNDFVHVNWGWDGQGDGYYDIALLNPFNYSFSQNQQMIYGIMPDDTGEDFAFLPRMIMKGKIKTDTEAVLYSKTGSSEFNVVVPPLLNPNAETLSGVATVSLYDERGQVVKKDIKNTKMYLLTFDLASYFMLNDSYSITCKIPTGLEDGVYYMKVLIKYNKQSEWIEPDTEGGQQNNYVRAVIGNGKVTFDTTPISDIKGVGYDMPELKGSELYGIDGRKTTTPSVNGNVVIMKKGKYVRKVIM